MLYRWIPRAARIGGLLLSGFVAGCGGGGGGDSADRSLQLTLSTQLLNLTVRTGAPLGTGAQALTATASGGTGNESLFIGAEITGVGIVTPLTVVIDPVGRIGRADVVPDPSLAVGRYSGTLRLLACLDAACATPLRGSPYTVNYTVEVTPRLSASTDALDFAMAESGAVAAQDVTVVLPAGATSATASVSYPSGPSGWLQVTRQGTVFTAQPADTLPAGSYRADLTLDVGDPQQALTLPVRFEVSAGLSVQRNVALTIDSTTPPSGTQGSLVVNAASGAQVTAWAARSTAAWLVVDTSTGVPGGSLAWHLDIAAFSALANGSTHSGDIVVEAGGTVSPVTVTIAAAKQLAELRGMDHTGLLAGEAGEVLLYGDGFDQLAGALAQRVGFGNVTPLALTRVGSKAISVQLPALAAGSYSVTLSSAAGITTRALALRVVASRGLGWLTEPTSGLKGGMVWDPLTQSAFVLNRTTSSVMRFQVDGTVGAPTVATSSRTIADLVAIGLAPDRQAVLALTADGTLLDLRTADLSTLRTRALGVAARQEMAHFPLAVSADDRLWLSTGTLASYDLALDRLDAAPLLDGAALTSPWGLVSGNGRHLLMVAGPAGFGQSSIVRRDAANGTFSRFGIDVAPSSFNRASANRAGTRWIIDNRALHDADLGTLGLLTPPPGWFATQSAVTRDGSRAYLFTRDAVNANSRIHVFDTSVARGAAGSFPVLGYLEPLLQPSCSDQVQGAGCDSFGTRILITDDDRNLIVVGDRQFGVVPLSLPLR